MNDDMYEFAKEEYEKISIIANEINNTYWVRTGNNLPDDNAIFAALAFAINAAARGKILILDRETKTVKEVDAK